MTDMFLLLQLPNAGDDLQAIKKGVMEIADLIVINKVDIDPDAAMRAQLFITSSLRLLGFQGNPDHASHNQEYWHPTVMTLSALEGRGIPELWEKILHFQKLQNHNVRLDARRKHQSGAWMWDRIDAGHAARRAALAAHLADARLLPLRSTAAGPGLRLEFPKSLRSAEVSSPEVCSARNKRRRAFAMSDSNHHRCARTAADKGPPAA